MNKVYLLGNQIGNIEDFPVRSKEKIETASLVLFESDMYFNKIVNNLNIKMAGEALKFVDNQDIRDKAIDALSTGDVAIISDFGYPIIADPGNKFCSYLIDKGVEVSVIPGPSIPSTAQVLSLIHPFIPEFLWQEFYHHSKENKIKKLEHMIGLDCNLIIIDHPDSINETLELIGDIFKERPAAIMYDLSMSTEKVIRAKCNNLLQIHQEVIKEKPVPGSFVEEKFATIVISPIIGNAA